MKILNLPAEGSLLVITDLHGDYKDFKKYEKIWNEFLDNGNQVILTGDIIHSYNSDEDNSVEILESVMEYCEAKNFHLLLGNHEWCHIVGKPVYKGESNQKKDFEELLKVKFGYRWVKKLDEYVEFFKKLPLAAKTSNGVLISHAGPPRDLPNLEKLESLPVDDYLFSDKLNGLLWRRDHQFHSKDLEFFLKHNACKYHVVGHTPVDGYQVNYGKQLVISSSFSYDRKAYLELNLQKEIKDMDELITMIQFLEDEIQGANKVN